MRMITIWFDGGARPTNPGKGYGSYEIKSEGLNFKMERQEFGEQLSNNEAEYLSLIHALKWVWPKVTLGVEYHLHVLTDSSLIANQLTGKWKTKAPHIKLLRTEAKTLLDRIGQWQIQWHGRQNNVKRFGH